MSKLVYFLLISSSYQLETYYKEFPTCKDCIDAIGLSEFSSMCHGLDKKIYGCNSAPVEPPNSQSPSYSEYSYKNNVDEYIEYNNDEQNRLEHEKYCTASDDVTCYADSAMPLGLEYCFNDQIPSQLRSNVDKCQDTSQSKLYDKETPNYMYENGLE